MSEISASQKGLKFPKNGALQKFPQLNKIKGLFYDVANPKEPQMWMECS